MGDAKFNVGDEVVWSSRNANGTRRYVVEKVGRTLVYLKGDRKPYRIADGARHDGYGHAHIRTLAQYEADETFGAALAYFRTYGLSFDGWRGDKSRLLWAHKTLAEAEKEVSRA